MAPILMAQVMAQTWLKSLISPSQDQLQLPFDLRF